MNFLEAIGLLACVAIILLIFKLFQEQEEASTNRRIENQLKDAWSSEKTMLIYLCVVNNEYPYWISSLKEYVETSTSYYISLADRYSTQKILGNLKEEEFQERQIDEIISEVNRIVKFKSTLTNNEDYDVFKKISCNYGYKLENINLFWSNNKIIKKI